MMFTFCSNGQDNLSYNNPPTNYIQNDYQKVTFVSNNLQSGEIFSSSEDNENNSVFTRIHSGLSNSNNLDLTNKITQSNWESIHNLSTNRKSTGLIRAP